MWRAEPWEGEGFGRALLGVGARGRNRGLDRKRRETAQSMAAQQCAGGKRSRDASEALNDVAGTFRCSITSSLVLDPVTTCDGQLYERGAIEEWLTMHSTSPNTGERLSSKMLTPSQAIKGAVERLVFSGCLAPEESREWMLRKAVTMLAKGEDTEAQPLLVADAKQGAAEPLSQDLGQPGGTCRVGWHRRQRGRYCTGRGSGAEFISKNPQVPQGGVGR